MGRKSKAHFIVRDHDDQISLSAAGLPESFPSRDAAASRARALATEHPGQEIFIYEAIGVAVCAVADPKVETVKPSKKRA